MNKIIKSSIATVGIAASLPAGALANDEYVAPQTFEEAKTNLDTETGKYNVSKKSADEKTTNKNVADKKFADSERNLKTSEENVVKTDKQIDTTIDQTKLDAKKKVEDTTKNISDLKEKKTSLEKEIPEQEKAVDDAKAQVKSAEDAVNKIKSENPTLAHDMSAAEKDKSDHTAKSEELKSQIASLNNEKQAKQNEIATKNTAITAAQNELATKTSALNTAKANVATTQAAVDKAQSVLNALTAGNEAYEQALANVNTAKANLANANNVKAGIESRISALNTSIVANKNAIANANNQIATINAKVNALNNAKSVEIQAEDNVKRENENIESKKSELADAEQGVTASKAKLNVENAKLENLKNEKTELENKLAEEQVKLKEAEKEVANARTESQKRAQAQFNKGSLGFFEVMGSEDAVAELKSKAKSVYTGATFTDSTHIGDADDATSLEYMLRALQLAKIGNAHRSQGDNNFAPMSELKVSDRLMARAQVNANFSNSPKISHSLNRGPNGDFSTGENLAWGYDWQTDGDHPYKGWYNDEKATYDNHSGGVTGHYTSLMKKDWVATGIAFAMNNEEYGSTCSQVFTDEDAGNGTLYTIDEYEARLTGYVNNLMEIIKNGDPLAIKDAQDKANTIKSKIENITANLNAKNSEIEDEKTEIGLTSKMLSDIEARVETINNELNELNKRPAQAELDKAKEDVKSAENALNSIVDATTSTLTPEQATRVNASSDKVAELITIFGEEIDTQTVNKTKLENGLAQANVDLQNAEDDIKTKTKALEDANAELKALSGTIDEATTALENANAELEAKKAIEAEKAQELYDATTSLNALNLELQTLQNELNTIDASISDKSTNLETVTEMIRVDEERLIALNKIFDKVVDAENNLVDAKVDLQRKEKALENKKKELVDTINSIDENTTNLEKLKKRALAAESLDRSNADTYKDFPEVQAAVAAYEKALKDVEDAKKTLADATVDRDKANEEYNLAMANFKESKFRYDRALADYNRLKPVEVKKHQTSKKTSKRFAKTNKSVKSPKTGDETALLANMGILALAGYAATKAAKKRKSDR